MRLYLPQEDPDPKRRAEDLAARAALYAFSRDHYDTLFVREVPSDEGYDAPYALDAVGVALKLFANRAAQRHEAWPSLASELTGLAAAAPHRAVAAVLDRLWTTKDYLPKQRPLSVDGYDDLLAKVPRPRAFGLAGDDDFFAWRQVAGMAPITLRGIREVPENVPLDAAAYARAVGEVDRLDAALAEGRVFISDYALLDGMTAGVSEGMQKYVYAPIAVFATLPDKSFRPVAIQVGQRPEPGVPLWTPQDGVAWRMAKTVVNNAEMLFNGLVAHFGNCHLVAEALICVSHRTLAPTHPLLHLLTPHFRYTMATNETARTTIVNPGGKQEFLMGGTLDANFAVVHRAFAAARYDAIGARADLAARRVDDPATLPAYPFRDDGVPIADALQRWAEAYLRVYYADDGAVRADAELRAWAAALAQDARFGGMPPLDTVAALARFVGDLLWRITGYHAVMNYAGYDHAGWVTGMPSALFGPAPRAGATEADWRAMLPPLTVANGMIEQMFSLYDIRRNTLGDYPRGHFDDDRVAAPLARLRGELAAIEEATAARNASRRWDFSYLLPSMVSNSIHV